MRYRRLGGAGVRVSEVSLGSWLTYGNVVDDKKARACVRRAYELGIRFFDTADAYARGRAEETLGRLLADFPRHDLVIASKCYFPMGEAPNDRGLSRKHVLEACDASLRRLGVDYLDLYQAHRYDEEVPLEEVVLAMDHLVRQGKVLYWGTSNWSALQLNESVHLARSRGLYPQVSDQPCYNPLFRHIEGDTTHVARKHGLGFVVYSPLAQGVLTGKYRGGDTPRGSRASDDRINQFIGRWITPENLERVDRFVALAEGVGCRPAQLALAWCLRWPEVSSVIIGASSPDQVEENAAASDLDLPKDVFERVDSIFAGEG